MENVMRLLLKYLRPSAASTEQSDATRREERTSEIQALLDEIAVVPTPDTAQEGKDERVSPDRAELCCA